MVFVIWVGVVIVVKIKYIVLISVFCKINFKI